MNDDEAKRLQEFIRTAQSKYNCFVNNRNKLIDKLNEIADQVGEVKKNTAIGATVSSAVGIAGGAMTVGSALFPPLLIPGSCLCTCALVGSSVSSAADLLWNKSLKRNVKKKCKKDSKYLDNLQIAIEAVVEFIQELAKVAGVNVMPATARLLRQDPNGEAKAGTGVVAIGNTALHILNIVFKTWSLFSSLDTDSNSEPSEFAAKLREMATSLKEELDKVQADVEELETICGDFWDHESE